MQYANNQQVKMWYTCNIHTCMLYIICIYIHAYHGVHWTFRKLCDHMWSSIVSYVEHMWYIHLYGIALCSQDLQEAM